MFSPTLGPATQTIQLSGCVPEFLGLPGAGGYTRPGMEGWRVLSTDADDTATSTSIQASASPRPSRFGRPVDSLLPALRPSFRGCGSSWTAERLYFGHSLIAVYIMGDITSRLQLACLGEGRRGSARVTRSEPWVTASRSTSLWSLRAIPDSQTEITRHAGDRRGVGLAPLA